MAKCLNGTGCPSEPVCPTAPVCPSSPRRACSPCAPRPIVCCPKKDQAWRWQTTNSEYGKFYVSIHREVNEPYQSSSNFDVDLIGLSTCSSQGKLWPLPASVIACDSMDCYFRSGNHLKFGQITQKVRILTEFHCQLHDIMSNT